MNRTPEQIEDEMLVLDAQAGDRAAVAALARRWYPRMARHARLMADDDSSAADAVQEAWLGIVRGLARLSDPADFAAWAMRIVSNKCADLVRQRSRRRALSAELAEQGLSDVGLRQPDGGDETEMLRRAIGALPPPLRETVSLFYGCGLDVQQTASALSIPQGTVKSRLNEARARLRAAIERSMT